MTETTIKQKTWCEEDLHHHYELFEDFNEWLESEEGAAIREQNGIDTLTQPSKAFFAGDKSLYDQAFAEYRQQRINEVLNKDYLTERFGDTHWFERNLSRFEQLVTASAAGDVVPFVGAGLSVGAGFPSWRDHLRQQGKTAGLNQQEVELALVNGQFEDIIAQIEAVRGRNVFVKEIQDVFSKTGVMTSATLLITELFSNTLITTNYDRLLEDALDTGGGRKVEVINGLEPLTDLDGTKITVIKLHGDVLNPKLCMLSKQQYDAAYGSPALDLNLPIPSRLEYHYKNSSLLFLGCSLSNDRTMQVFKAVQEQSGDTLIPNHFCFEQTPETEQELQDRNAFLVNHGITPIWFERGNYSNVEELLRLLRNELRYKKAI